MAMETSPVEPSALRVVIVGGGTAGWMCAAGLSRLVDPSAYSLTLIESDEIGAVGVGEATLPHIKIFNDMLGIREAEFMSQTQGTFKLGIEFRAWGGVHFQHHWLRARNAGVSVAPLEAYSYAIAACRAGAFEFPSEDPKSIRSTYAYAYHFDASLYANFLRRWTMARGVQRIEGQVVEVARGGEDGLIEAVTLKSGVRVEGDLFIDCSGFRALLIGDAMQVGWQDWTAWLPCDRALAVPCERTADFTPYTRSTAQEGGWTWRIPLQHRTGNGYVFSSRFTDEERARDILLRALDAPALVEPKLLRFSPGRREQAWSGNCVAVGLASGFLEPLESTSIFLIQGAVTDLANLMPAAGGGRRMDPRLANEFNRLFAIQYDRVRDFLVLHYRANARHGQPLWDYVRTMPLPDTLVEKMSLFEARAWTPDYTYGLFARDSWLSVLMGQGVIPRGYDRLAEGLSLAEAEANLERLKARIDANVAAMSSHGSFIANYCDPTGGAGTQPLATVR
jgi:tryptophan halogenase